MVLWGSLELGCPTWWRIPARNRFKTADGQGWRTTTTTPPAIIPVVLQGSIPRSHRCLANKRLPDGRPRGQPPNKVLAQSRELLLHCGKHGRQGTWPNLVVPKVATGRQRMWVDPKAKERNRMSAASRPSISHETLSLSGPMRACMCDLVSNGVLHVWPARPVEATMLRISNSNESTTSSDGFHRSPPPKNRGASIQLCHGCHMRPQTRSGRHICSAHVARKTQMKRTLGQIG